MLASPYYCYMESRAKIFFILRAFAAGVVLTTGRCEHAMSAVWAPDRLTHLTRVQAMCTCLVMHILF